MVTVLVTGFGPFPGAPFNPTAPLVNRLARLRRSGVKIVPHVFPTSYAAVDHDFPVLIARHRPAALLMFGLAPRARALRIETRARNALSLLPDAAGASPLNHAIAARGPAVAALPAPVHTLLAAARAARVHTALSHDAGRYLCNYLCWRAAEATLRRGGPRVAAFIHVPSVRRGTAHVPPGKGRATLSDLVRAGAAVLAVIAVAARR